MPARVARRRRERRPAPRGAWRSRRGSSSRRAASPPRPLRPARIRRRGRARSCAASPVAAARAAPPPARRDRRPAPASAASASRQSNGDAMAPSSQPRSSGCGGKRRRRVSAVGEGGVQVHRGSVARKVRAGRGRGGRTTARPAAGRTDRRRAAAVLRLQCTTGRPLCPPRAPPQAPSAHPTAVPGPGSFACWRGAASRAWLLFALVLLAIRFIVFPQVESQRERVAAMLSATTGPAGRNRRHRHRLGRLEPEAGRSPISGCATASRRARRRCVELPEVDVTLAWTSLPLMQLRLKQLVIERPRLAIRRDRGGLLHVAGLEFDPTQQADDSTLTDWLLRQRRIIVRDALITWNDDLRNAPQLVLDRVQFRLENEAFGRHRIGLTGTPPAELAAPIDIRGRGCGRIAAGMAAHRGPRVRAARLRRRRRVARMAAAAGADRPGQGRPAALVRLRAEAGSPGLIADVELADVRTRLAEGLPELELPHLSGRMGWKDAGGERELAFRHLAFTTASGVEQPPVDLALRLSLPGGDRAAGGEIVVRPASNSSRCARWPRSCRCPNGVRVDLARLAPQGALTKTRLRWDGGWDAPVGLFADERVRAARHRAAGRRARRARGLAAASRPRRPAARCGSPAAISRSTRRRTSRSRSRSTRSTPTCGWTRDAARTEVQRGEARVREPPGDRQRQGHLAFAAAGSGRNRPHARRSRAPTSASCTATCRAGCRLRPATGCASGCCRGPARTPAWSSRATSRSSRSPAARTGSSWSRSRRAASTSNYADGWPRLAARGRGRAVRGPRPAHRPAARRGAGGAGRADARRHSGSQRRTIRSSTIVGEARGPTAEFLRFIDAQPGGGLDRPLHRRHRRAGTGAAGAAPRTAAGQGRGSTGGRRILARRTTSFSSSACRRSGKSTASSSSPSRTSAGGTSRPKSWAARSGSHCPPPKAACASPRTEPPTWCRSVASGRRSSRARVAGSADWTFTADVRPRFSAWTIESSLRGAAFDLPAPLAKSAAESVPLKIERRAVANAANEDALTIAYGSRLAAAVHRRLDERGDAHIDRVHVLVGAAVERGEQPACRAPRGLGHGRPARAQRRRLARVVAGGGCRNGAGPAAGNAALPAVQGIDLDAVHFEAIGRRLNDTRLAARRAGDDWRFDIRGREIAGTGVWSAATAGCAERPAGRAPRAACRSSRRGARPVDGASPKRGASARPMRANPWPTLDVEADAVRRAGARPRAPRARRAAAGQRLADRADDARQRRRAPRRRGQLAGRRRAAADEARRDARRDGRRRVPRAARLPRRRSSARRPGSTASSRGRARRTSSTTRRSPARSACDAAPGDSPRSIRASASCSACCRCRRCRDGSRSTSATSSAKASRSTTSTATCASATA